MKNELVFPFGIGSLIIGYIVFVVLYFGLDWVTILSDIIVPVVVIVFCLVMLFHPWRNTEKDK